MFLKKTKASYWTFKAPLPVSDQRRRIKVEVDRFITLLNDAMGPGMPDALAGVIRKLSEHSGEIQRGLVVWVRLIEVLVQQAERTGGSGQLKKSDVTAALHYLIQESQFEIPTIPRYLQPVILDIAVDWTIEMVVSETNRYGLWTAEAPAPPSLMSFIRMTIKRIKLWTRPFWEGLAGLLARIYVALRYSEPLSPELKAAVDAVEADGFFIDKRDFLRTGTETVIFIGEHGPQVIAIFRLVFEAVREAEIFGNMTGPEKKQYATDVVLTVLEELGFPVDSGIIGAIIRSFVDGAIESAVDIFNRRAPELFQRSSA